MQTVAAFLYGVRSKRRTAKINLFVLTYADLYLQYMYILLRFQDCPSAVLYGPGPGTRVRFSLVALAMFISPV